MKEKVSKASSKAASKQKPLSHSVGRRKAAVARVWLRKGSGKVQVNGIDYAEYFDTESARLEANKPFTVVESAGDFDADIRVQGGGKKGQAGAVQLGIARAMVSVDEQNKPVLREHGMLTVDSRLKERKKYGQRGARRKFQFVKR